MYSGIRIIYICFEVLWLGHIPTSCRTDFRLLFYGRCFCLSAYNSIKTSWCLLVLSKLCKCYIPIVFCFFDGWHKNNKSYSGMIVCWPGRKKKDGRKSLRERERKRTLTGHPLRPTSFRAKYKHIPTNK